MRLRNCPSAWIVTCQWRPKSLKLLTYSEPRYMSSVWLTSLSDDAQRRGLLAVDVHEKLRRVRAELRLHADQPGHSLLQLAHQRVGLLLQRRKPQAAAVFDHRLEPAGDAQSRHRRRAVHRDHRVLDLVRPCVAQLGHDRRVGQMRACAARRTA